MNPGELNRYVALQGISASRDAFGAEILTWETLAYVWAKIEPLSGGEAYVSDKIQTQASHRITIYHRSDVTAEHRVVYGGYAYDILLVQEVGLHEALELLVQWTNEAVTLVGVGLVDFDEEALATFAGETMEAFA